VPGNLETPETPSFAAPEDMFRQRQPDQPVWLLCSDRRPLSKQSAAAFAALPGDILPPNEGGVAVAGQLQGLAHATAVAVLALHEETRDAEKVYAGLLHGIVGIGDRLLQYMLQSGPYAVTPALHSATPNELPALGKTDFRDGDHYTIRNPAERGILAADRERRLFYERGTSPVGCHYYGQISMISRAIGNNKPVQELVGDALQTVTGNDTHLERIIRASEHLARMLGESYTYGRQDIVRSPLPIMVLDGSNGGEDIVPDGVVFNNDPRTISRPGKYTHHDIAAAAATIKLNGFRKLDTGLLLQILVAHATVLQPKLPTAVYGGSSSEAVERINQIVPPKLAN
jgi:hypothetical protein